jgi:hypothetical protein
VSTTAPDLFEQIRQNPCVLDDLTPRAFEELVAEVLASFGWEISLTPSFRDGGYDILAVVKDPSGFDTTWIVECKRFSRERRIQLGAIQRLLGVKMALDVPQALLVTTSYLTRDAAALTQRSNGLQVADRDRLLGWINQYRPPRGSEAYLPRQKFSSCFISYSTQDESFVTQMVGRLREAGVRVWFAPEDMVGGKKLYDEIRDAIERFDRLLIVLSVSSINSEWVKSEIRNARKREVREGRRVLFPISLIDFETLRAWELFDADLGHDIARELREYFIPDFSNWQDASAFEYQFTKVVAGLIEVGA